MSTKPTRRIIPSGSNITHIIAGPDIDHMINDALQVIQGEIIKFHKKSQTDAKTITLAEARVLQGYIKSLAELSKEIRERDNNDLNNMTDEELAKFAQELFQKSAKKPAGE